MFHGTEFNGQKIGVEPAKRKFARDKTPGKYLGRSKRRRSFSEFNIDQQRADLEGETGTETIAEGRGTETIGTGVEREAGESDREIEGTETGKETVTIAIEETEAGTGAGTEETEEVVRKSDIVAETVLNNL